MDDHQLTFYSLLSRIPLLQKSYVLKVILIALLGILVTVGLLTFYIFLSGRFSLDQKAHIFMILMLSTAGGILISTYLLYALLQPVTLISSTLHAYVNENVEPNLPIGFEDMVGKIMTNVQHTLEKLNTLAVSSAQGLSIDPLTGILSQQAGEKHLSEDVARAYRDGSSMLLAIIEIDNLDDIRERFGQHVSDVCLTHIAEVTNKNIREGDWLSRWGEDKFIMVLWNFSHDTPATVLERIQQHSIKTPMGELLEVSLSIGACEYNGEDNADALLLRAGEALAVVRRTGHGSVAVAD